MFLNNPFSLDTRLLYLGVWYCWICGGNGQNKGGLELHHIVGRSSNSPLNSALLCHECHSHMGHSQEEERALFLKTLRFLRSIKYQLTSQDMYFMEDNKQRLISEEVIEWIKSI